VLAFALLGGYGVVRWLRRRRDPRRRQIVHIVALGVLAAAVGFFVAGDRRCRRAIRCVHGDRAVVARGWINEGGFVPFDGFVQEPRSGSASGGPRGRRVRRTRGGRRGDRRGDRFRAARAAARVEIRLWSASYVLYLLVVFFPQSSIFRLLLPLAPLYGAIAVPRRTSGAGVLGRTHRPMVVDLPDAGDRELVHPDPLIATSGTPRAAVSRHTDKLDR
jgi:hypothetical protein